MLQIVCIYEWGIFIGYRMTKLLDEEVEEDELFWNQDALKEVYLNRFNLFSSLGTILSYNRFA